jgi:uncharacterized protein (TIGR02145 family)
MNKENLLLYFIIATVIPLFFLSCSKNSMPKQFPPKQPCPGIAEVEYGGEIYPTILIGEQCWMAKNLNIGKRIDHVIEARDNDTIEKYCYLNLEEYCDYYGGLYQWDELMQYSTIGEGQGICPDGWRIPSVTDYAQLYTYVEGYSGPLRKQYDCWYRIEPFENLQDTCNRNGGQTGFDLLPAGKTDLGYNSVKFEGLNWWAYLWMENKNYLFGNYNGISFYTASDEDVQNAFMSVRCIKNTETLKNLNQ